MTPRAKLELGSHLPALCTATQAVLSDYLDGAVTGVKMREITEHLADCARCDTEFSLAYRMQETLASIGPIKAPEELGLKLRLAISREQSRSWTSRLDRLSLSWQNGFRPIVVQACAGLAGAVVLLGSILFLLGAMSTANPVMANDEPLGAMTAPHYLYSVTGIQPVVTPEDGTIVIEAAINARGQVYDYKIVSGPRDVGVRHQIVDRLLSSVFRPASVFGVPVRGHVIVTFSGVSVRG